VLSTRLGWQAFDLTEDMESADVIAAFAKRG
jgi:hypothetical protein